MAKVKLAKQVALDILDGDKSQGEVVLDEITGKGRWSIRYRVVFKIGDKFLLGSYSVGATENQDEGPWEHQDNPEFEEVEAYERTITDYRSIQRTEAA
jgi:hypothetical protein